MGDESFDVPEDDAPAVLPVELLIETPEGYVRAGDEVHLPSNWIVCPACGLDNPIDYDQCFDCGEVLDG